MKRQACCIPAIVQGNSTTTLENESFSSLPRKFNNLIFHALTPLLFFLQSFPVLAGTQLQAIGEGYGEGG